MEDKVESCFLSCPLSVGNQDSGGLAAVMGFASLGYLGESTLAGGCRVLWWVWRFAVATHAAHGSYYSILSMEATLVALPYFQCFTVATRVAHGCYLFSDFYGGYSCSSSIFLCYFGRLLSRNSREYI